MIRTILAVAAAPLAAMMLLAAPAQACISCDYVPEVVRQHSTTPSEGRSYQKSRSRQAEERRSATSKKRTVKSEPTPRKVDTAKAPTSTKSEKVETAAAPAPSQAENEHSSFAATDTGTKKVETAAIAPATSGSQTENSTISTATLDTRKSADATDKADDAAKVSTSVGCKKFFPSVGMTLTVACE